MTLKPKIIEPGWAKRWTRQSIDLFRRAPGLAIATMSLFCLVNAVIPQPLALDVPITAFLVGLLFSALRAADLNSGNAWSAAWRFFRQSARDIALLSRDVFVAMLAFGLIIWLLLTLYSAVTHGAGIVKPDPAYFHLPVWLRHGVSREGSMVILGIFMPGVAQMIFLTMSVGNQPLMHYITGYQSVVLNLALGYSTIGAMLVCSFLPPVLRQLPSLWLGYALMAGFTAAFWWFGTWGYLWCREMFEGTTENARETLAERSPAKRRAHVSGAA